MSLVDAGTSDTGIPYLVLQDLPGQHLDTFVATTRPSCESLRRIMSAICRALIMCHRIGIVHADIKPSNILVSRDGTPVLLDFGVAQDVHSESTVQASLTTPTPSTPAFASPEITAGQRATPESDVYAVGRLLEELIPTCAGTSRRKDPLLSLAARCTDRDPTRRPRTADQLLEHLEHTAGPITRMPSISVLTIGLVGGLAIGLAAFPALAPVSSLRPPEGDTDSPLLLDLASLHPDDVPGNPETIDSLAKTSQSVDLQVLAAYRYAAEGRREKARDLIDALGSSIETTAPAYRVIAGRVLLDLGRPGPALSTLQQLDAAELRASDRTLHTFLLLRTQDRLGRHTPDLAWDSLQIDAEQQQLHDLLDTIFLQRIAMGHHEPVRNLVDDDERLRQPLSELDPRLAEAVLVLYTRLRACGQAGPLDKQILDTTEREIDERSFASRDPAHPRLQATLALARAASEYHTDQILTGSAYANATAAARRDDAPEDFRAQLFMAASRGAGDPVSSGDARPDEFLALMTSAYGSLADEILGTDTPLLPVFLRWTSPINIDRPPGRPDLWWWPPP